MGRNSILCWSCGDEHLKWDCPHKLKKKESGFVTRVYMVWWLRVPWMLNSRHWANFLDYLIWCWSFMSLNFMFLIGYFIFEYAWPCCFVFNFSSMMVFADLISFCDVAFYFSSCISYWFYNFPLIYILGASDQVGLGGRKATCSWERGSTWIAYWVLLDKLASTW